jgi:hypothetical protein
MSKVEFFEFFKNEDKLIKVLCYPASETLNDPYEQTKTTNFLNPLTIKALVSPLSFESLRWKFYGQIPLGSKQLIVRKQDISLIVNAFKIKIEEDYYKCYSDDAKGFAIKEYADYAYVILEKKNV